MSWRNGSTDLQPRGADPYREQLDRLRRLLDSVEDGAATADLAGTVKAEALSASDASPGVQVFSDLLRIESRPSRYHRLLRTWVGKVSGAIRQGDFESAGVWMRALNEAPIDSAELTERVQGAMSELSRSDLLEELVLRLAASGEPEAAQPLLAAWGEPLVDYLIDGMLVDDPPVNRRHLVEYLGMVGTGDLGLVLGHLKDPRWFIVRNVAIAVGRTGNREAIPALEAVAAHEDDRVRVEVLRALAYLEGEDSLPRVLAAFSDPSSRVRQAAVSLLRASPSPEVIGGSLKLIETKSVSGPDGRRLVEVIAERKEEAALDALSTLAAKRFAVGASRIAREAARAALIERGEHE